MDVQVTSRLPHVKKVKNDVNGVGSVRTGVFVAGHVSCFQMNPYSLWTSLTGVVGSGDNEMNVSNVMEEDKIYTLNVSYDTTSHKVRNSSTVRVIIPVIKGKTQVVKMFAVDSLLKLEVVLGASESEVSFRNLELHGFDWPVEDEALLTFKNHKQDPHLLFLPEDILGANDTNFYLVIRVKKGQIFHGEVDESHRLKSQIGIQTFTVECSYWSEAHEEWKQDGCMVSPFTTVTTLHCWCSHLTVFSGGIFISPNTVDPIGDIALFLTFFQNPVVVTLVVAVWILFIMLLIWARRVDQNDLREEMLHMPYVAWHCPAERVLSVDPQDFIR
ncbi:uncharacterized protein LOC121378062 [Gigantopelta aegis]|uniref:uncharacterized protein LOC121378062 n=1 Tax=Gigantopelta aegis TaxID=1735272 RepID=UPI001B889AD7|nr:uncharacterized protein LOC121378062 [Gigantopelta aegis]